MVGHAFGSHHRYPDGFVLFTGTLFARVARRYASRGMRVAKIAGQQAYRSGKLLSL